MATLPVYNLRREEVGKIDVSDEVFGANVNRHLFYEVVKWQLAKRRAGSAHTKGRAQVRGGGAKPYKQKGTGRARQGSIRAPQWSGGGSVFGPVPRSHGHELPKKVRRAALRGIRLLGKLDGGRSCTLSGVSDENLLLPRLDSRSVILAGGTIPLWLNVFAMNSAPLKHRICQTFVPAMSAHSLIRITMKLHSCGFVIFNIK